MSTLVTGGRGFVGRYIVEQLLAAREPVVSYNRDYALDDRPGLTVVQGELFDLPRLVRALQDHSVSRIIHTAGQSHPGVSIDLPLTTFAANADGTIAVYEAARMTGVRRIVNFSSECALGNVDRELVDETVTPAPTTPYGVTKVAGELLGSVYNNLYGTEIVSLRVTEVYGPGLWMPSLLGDMIRAALAGEPVALAHGGQHPFQFVHAADVAAAAVLASTATPFQQSVYNVSGGVQVTVAELAGLLREAIPGARFDIGDGYLPDWDRQGRYDLSAAERELGYKPQWTLKDGLADTIAWIRSTAQS
ncbi:NAD-dependent epimerase/dehydratase family protein [Streptomyces sp. NPDC056352]|uniref:NAD-dependent epimerase/dehydratase family protein n=1 Tax=Streptomyces sp. NPDC056352 TaxID=3345791 RepID=UPI0035E059D5